MLSIYTLIDLNNMWGESPLGQSALSLLLQHTIIFTLIIQVYKAENRLLRLQLIRCKATQGTRFKILYKRNKISHSTFYINIRIKPTQAGMRGPLTSTFRESLDFDAISAYNPNIIPQTEQLLNETVIEQAERLPDQSSTILFQKKI